MKSCVMAGWLMTVSVGNAIVVICAEARLTDNMVRTGVHFCFVVNNKCIAATNGFKLCSLISVNTHMRSKSIVEIQQS